MRWQAKSALLRRVFSWPTGFLAVGRANRKYYETFGVGAERIFLCPHSIDVGPLRAASRAVRRRRSVGAGKSASRGARSCLFAGKFEKKKRPIRLMNAVRSVQVQDLY